MAPFDNTALRKLLLNAWTEFFVISVIFNDLNQSKLIITVLTLLEHITFRQCLLTLIIEQLDICCRMTIDHSK